MSSFEGTDDPAPAVDRFLQAVSHELRTPLNGIMATLRLMREERDPGEREALFEALEHSSERLGGMVDSILTYTALECGDLLPWKQHFQPLALFTEVAVRARTLLNRRRGVSLLAHVDNPETWVEADANRIEKVVMELVRNADAATERGEITISAEVSERQLTVEISDQGCGVPPEEQERIFEPFYRIPQGPTRTKEGAGLGLAVARALCSRLGGSLNLVASSPSGSTFRATFAAAPGMPAPRMHVVGIEALVVDDDRINRLVLSKTLKRLGCEVMLAEDGLQAVEAVKARPFDVVLMDCEMPGMDGLTAAREIRSFNPNVPVIAITAYATDNVRNRCFQAGMSDFLTKPISAGMLESTLRRWARPGHWMIRA